MISVTSAITNCTENQQGIVNVILSSKPLIPCESIRISIETDELAETIKLNGVEINTDLFAGENLDDLDDLDNLDVDDDDNEIEEEAKDN